jgi:hypothetical protein
MTTVNDTPDGDDLYTVMFNPGPDWFRREAEVSRDAGGPAPSPDEYPVVAKRGLATIDAAGTWIWRQRGQYPDPEYYIVGSALPDEDKRAAVRMPRVRHP